jgi:hypothetical protein
MEEIERIRKLLQKLANFIYAVTIDCKEQGTLEPEYTTYIRHRVTEFEYQENGIISKVVEPEEFSSPTWNRASLDMYYDRIQDHKVLQDALTALENSSISEVINPEMSLKGLTRIIVNHTLEGRISHPEDLSKYVDLFMQQFNEDEPEREYTIDSHLKGLTIQPSSILLDECTTLRKPTSNNWK